MCCHSIVENVYRVNRKGLLSVCSTAHCSICSEMAIGPQIHATQRNITFYENAFSCLKHSESLLVCSNDADGQNYAISAERGCGRPKRRSCTQSQSARPTKKTVHVSIKTGKK